MPKHQQNQACLTDVAPPISTQSWVRYNNAFNFHALTMKGITTQVKNPFTLKVPSETSPNNLSPSPQSYHPAQCVHLPPSPNHTCITQHNVYTSPPPPIISPNTTCTPQSYQSYHPAQCVHLPLPQSYHPTQRVHLPFPQSYHPKQRVPPIILIYVHLSPSPNHTLNHISPKHSQPIDVTSLHKRLVELVREEPSIRSLSNVSLDESGSPCIGAPVLLGPLSSGECKVRVLPPTRR